MPISGGGKPALVPYAHTEAGVAAGATFVPIGNVIISVARSSGGPITLDLMWGAAVIEEGSGFVAGTQGMCKFAVCEGVSVGFKNTGGGAANLALVGVSF